MWRARAYVSAAVEDAQSHQRLWSSIFLHSVTSIILAIPLLTLINPSWQPSLPRMALLVTSPHGRLYARLAFALAVCSIVPIIQAIAVLLAKLQTKLRSRILKAWESQDKLPDREFLLAAKSPRSLVKPGEFSPLQPSERARYLQESSPFCRTMQRPKRTKPTSSANFAHKLPPQLSPPTLPYMPGVILNKRELRTCRRLQRSLERQSLHSRMGKMLSPDTPQSATH